ncbi:hypothetical protein Pla110_46290 [Polystyrenella longa]|uniref:Uncharacterized protein n=1 Tax=Polystyrenella longa TaxID=2528007 RepID=A0A518CUH0_9PLAN|nr:hypothetical protein Pla110_46290 [Polystyrenella longa]
MRGINLQAGQSLIPAGAGRRLDDLFEFLQERIDFGIGSHGNA